MPPEPAQPVFTRYWLHGKGPAPAGNVPVAVHFSPTRVTLGGSDATARATTSVTISAPADVAASAAGGAAAPSAGSGNRLARRPA